MPTCGNLNLQRTKHRPPGLFEREAQQAALERMGAFAEQARLPLSAHTEARCLERFTGSTDWLITTYRFIRSLR